MAVLDNSAEQDPAQAQNPEVLPAQPPSPMKRAMSLAFTRMGMQMLESSLEQAHARGGKPADLDFSGVADDLSTMLKERWRGQEFENWTKVELAPIQAEVDKFQSTFSTRSSALLEGKVLDENGMQVGEFNPNNQVALMQYGQKLYGEAANIASGFGNKIIDSAAKYGTNPLVQERMGAILERVSGALNDRMEFAMKSAEQVQGARLTEAKISDLLEKPVGSDREDKTAPDFFEWAESKGVQDPSQLPGLMEQSPEAWKIFSQTGGAGYIMAAEERVKSDLLRQAPAKYAGYEVEGSEGSVRLAQDVNKDRSKIMKWAFGSYLDATYGQANPALKEQMRQTNPDYFQIQVKPTRKVYSGAMTPTEIKQEVEKVKLEVDPETGENKQFTIETKAQNTMKNILRTEGNRFEDADQLVNYMMRTWWTQQASQYFDQDSPGGMKTVDGFEKELRTRLLKWAKSDDVMQELFKETGVKGPPGILDRFAKFAPTGGDPYASVPVEGILPSQEKPKRKGKKKRERK